MAQAMVKRIVFVGLALLLAGPVVGCSQAAASPQSSVPGTGARAAPVDGPASEQVPDDTEGVDGEEWSPVQTFNGQGNETTPPFHISGSEWRITWTIEAEYPEYAVFDLLVYPDGRHGLLAERISHWSAGAVGAACVYEGGRDYYIKVIAANLSEWSITVQDSAPVGQVAHREQWRTVETFTGKRSHTTAPFHVRGSEWRITWEVDADDPESAALELFVYSEAAPYAIWQTVSHPGGDGGDVTYVIPWVIPYDETRRDFFIKVLARNLDGWAITVEDNHVEASACGVRITDIHYRGTVYPPDPENCICLETVEPDEYVVIKNLGDCYQDISGWVLKNISKESASFTFPSESGLYPGDIIRVYASFPLPPGEFEEAYDRVEDEELGHIWRMDALYPYRFDDPPGDIWDNEEPDTAVLYNAEGEEVSRKSYVIPPEDGCSCR